MSRDEIEQSARDQAVEIADSLVKAGAYLPDRPALTGVPLSRHLAEAEITALIAYMQKLGTYVPVEKPKTVHPLDPDSQRTSNR